MDRVVEEAFKHTSNRVANSSNDQPNGHVNSHSAVNGSSSSSDVLRSALRVGFDFIVNIQPRYVAEQLARYVDRKLRGEQGVSEAEAELCLSRAMLVFKFLAEKDIFEAFYKKLLAKRLLLEKSASNDLERSMLSKLKTECGAQFTSKLEGMFSDLDLSAQCLAQFRTFAASSQGTNYVASSCAVETSSKLESLDADSFHLWLLTQGHWPNTTSGTNVSNNTSSSSSSSSNTNVGEDFPLSLPRELLPLKQQFQTFYESHFQGRRLLWGYSLSRAVVLVTFYSLNSNINSNSSNSSSTPKQRVYEVDVTLSQALVLRCFSTLDNYRTSSRNLPNTNGSWTAAQVSQQTGVPLEDATLCLLSFTAPLSKPSSVANASLTKLLIKQTHPAQAAQQELSFAVNMNFESRMRRMKVLLPTSVRDASTGQSVTSSSSTTTSAELETAQTLEEVFRERAYQCDAAIVRIMKARKRLLHAQLMAEVMQQLRFPSQNADIKKRIEALIERDYLERDPDDVNYYKYVA
jgi:cullin-4